MSKLIINMTPEETLEEVNRLIDKTIDDLCGLIKVGIKGRITIINGKIIDAIGKGLDDSK